MPNERASLNQVTQLGIETTPGTPVAATKLLTAMMWTPQVSVEQHFYRAAGHKYNTTSVIGKEWTAYKISGEPTFGELPYLLSGIAAKATPTQVSPSQGAYQWLYNPATRTIDNIQTYTVEQGSAERATQAGFAFLTGFDLKAGRKTLSITGDALAQSLTDGFSLTAITGTNEVITATITGTPAGGTFTLTFRGQTTSAIAYNATGATVQTALQLLSTVGNNATVTGAAGGPYIVTFAGQLGDQVIGAQLTATATFTGGSSPAIGLARSTPGVAITPEEPPAPLLPTQLALFVDASSGSIGTTLLTRAFTYEFSISGKAQGVWPFQQSNTTFPAMVEMPAKTKVSFFLEANSQGMIPLTTYLRPNATAFIRFQALGASLDGTNTQLLNLDAAVRFGQPSEFKDQDAIYGIEWSGELIEDVAWGAAWKATVQNYLPAL